MSLRSIRVVAVCVSGFLAATTLCGCHVSTNKNGGKDNVDIGTPFGSMHVKTNHDGVDSSLGISAYPGAVSVREGKGDDNGAANVSMSFGEFHLGVVARSYQTGDSADKVISFYRKDLARYGEVIQCEGKESVGSPSRTAQGLTCDENDTKHIKAGGRRDGLELRTGSPAHQRIVAVEEKDGGTRIAMIKLDLPSGPHSQSE